jgi:DNA-binding transcriptional LysR family regulator
VFDQLRNHLDKLHHFLHIAKSGSFRKAAAALHLTQPTLSYSIKLLEEVVGQPLFRRSSTGVKMTPSGQLLFEFCERYFIELDSLERRIRAPQDPHSGLVRIGTQESLLVNVWPRFIRSFSTENPNVGLHFLDATSLELSDRLLASDVDMTVSVEPPAHQRIHATDLYCDEFSFYISPGVMQVSNTAGRILHTHDLSASSVPMIYVPSARTAENKPIVQYLREAGLSGLSNRYELESFESVRAFACGGLGIAVLPQKLASRSLAEGSLISVQVKGFKAPGFGLHRVRACMRAEDSSHSLLQLLVGELRKDAGRCI